MLAGRFRVVQQLGFLIFMPIYRSVCVALGVKYSTYQNLIKPKIRRRGCTVPHMGLQWWAALGVKYIQGRIMGMGMTCILQTLPLKYVV